MPFQNGRNFLLKIGDGGAPEVFSTLGAARVTSMQLDNTPEETTAVSSTATGVAAFQADAGVQAMHITLEGFFKDSAAEERLRAVAFGRSACNYELFFPNGDKYAASFVVATYARGGGVEGFESFSTTLLRNGAGTFTAGG